MSKVVYVLTYEGGPDHVYTDINSIIKCCTEWYEERRDDFYIELDFNRWCEDRDYPNTEEGYEQAWNDYVAEQFENGTWGDYAWYETDMD